MLAEELKKRNLPEFLPDGTERWEDKRKALLDLMQKTEYGYAPKHCAVSPVDVVIDEHCFGSKAFQYDVKLKCELKNGSFSFPATAIIPNSAKQAPAVVLISFAEVIPSKNLPAEELTDEGLAVFTFCYKKVVPDDIDAFDSELAHILYPDGRKKDDAGTIALWAWAASRVMDWAVTFPQIDSSKVTVVGQSRLGKTALLAGALDERFAIAYSNESGCCGAAVFRGKEGEMISDIVGRFPYWFCDDFKQFAGREDELPFDQDALIAMMMPRRAYVASSAQDSWSDPHSEFLSCVSAGRIWDRYGKKGFVTPDLFPEENRAFHEGYVGYHMRSGTHTMNRNDWHFFLEYLRLHGILA